MTMRDRLELLLTQLYEPVYGSREHCRVFFKSSVEETNIHE